MIYRGYDIEETPFGVSIYLKMPSGDMRFISEEDTMEEAAAQGFGDTGNEKTSGANAGYTPAKKTNGDGKLHEGKSPLQVRFQKLANIIK